MVLVHADDGSIPSSNPFTGHANADFHKWYAYGVRNTFGLAFDPVTGNLWDSENGPNVFDEINLVAGFNFAPDTPATLTISGQSFDLFTEGDAAWLLDPARNDDLAGSIRAGSTLTIEGTTDKGIRVVESFSLSGATAASRAIESC